MSQPNAAQDQTTDTAPAPSATQPQPSVGSLAAHRPHPVAGGEYDLAAAKLAGIVADIDADPDDYEEDYASQEGAELPQGRFLDRERSWLAFNERVLELAEDPSTPSWNARTSWRSSPRTWTSSSWSGWRA